MSIKEACLRSWVSAPTARLSSCVLRLARKSKAKSRWAAAPYSVVETQGHNLLVTDNANNKLYFYTVDRDEKVALDLNGGRH